MPGLPRAGAWYFFFNDTATTEIYTLSLHDALPISGGLPAPISVPRIAGRPACCWPRSEEHTSELQSLRHLVCRLLLEKKYGQQLRARLPSRPGVDTDLLLQPADR